MYLREIDYENMNWTGQSTEPVAQFNDAFYIAGFS
jgi:hypothetical protein